MLKIMGANNCGRFNILLFMPEPEARGIKESIDNIQQIADAVQKGQ